MDQAQRKKDQYYRVKAQADRLKDEVGKWRAVVDLAEKELESAAAEIVALKSDVERMKAEHQAEVDRLGAELAAERARLDWLENLHEFHMDRVYDEEMREPLVRVKIETDHFLREIEAPTLREIAIKGMEVTD